MWCTNEEKKNVPVVNAGRCIIISTAANIDAISDPLNAI